MLISRSGKDRHRTHRAQTGPNVASVHKRLCNGCVGPSEACPEASRVTQNRMPTDPKLAAACDAFFAPCLITMKRGGLSPEIEFGGPMHIPRQYREHEIDPETLARLKKREKRKRRKKV